MWIFSVRLCRCRFLEETVTAGMVSLMLGGGFLWVLLFYTVTSQKTEEFISILGQHKHGIMTCIQDPLWCM